MTASITSAAKDNAVGGSYSRFRHSARIMRICIIPARVTDGVKQARAINSTTIGIPKNASRYRRLKLSTYTSANKIDICRPDTATIWLMPLTEKSVLIS